MSNLDYKLIGKRVSRLFVSNYDQGSLIFDTDEDQLIVWDTFGDCCSESWFYHVIGTDNLIGPLILKVEELLDREATDNYSKQEVDIIYGIKITTTRGYVDIEFRNSSNGYYSGWATSHQLNRKDFDISLYTEIKEDWTAFLV